MSDYNTKPSGLFPTDTLKDCLNRSDEISRPDGSCHSGMMCDRKDLRRIVLMAREIRSLQGKFRALAKAETSQEALNLASIKNLLPTNYSFSDENADIVIVLAELDEWCIVQNEGEEDPYVLPLEFVVSIYKEGNDS